jgi:TPR repeat protein
MDIPNLRRKADSDNAVAQSILGNCYLDGVEVGVDDEEAFRLLSSAASQGVSRVKANLARMHAEGLGVPKKLSEAIRLYEAQRKRESSLLRSALPGFMRKGWACQQTLARPLSGTLRQPLKRIGSPTAKTA